MRARGGASAEEGWSEGDRPLRDYFISKPVTFRLYSSFTTRTVKLLSDSHVSGQRGGGGHLCSQLSAAPLGLMQLCLQVLLQLLLRMQLLQQVLILLLQLSHGSAGACRLLLLHRVVHALQNITLLSRHRSSTSIISWLSPHLQSWGRGHMPVQLPLHQLVLGLPPPRLF